MSDQGSLELDDKRLCLPNKRLCAVGLYPFPSGRHLAHSRFCPDKPGQKISLDEYRTGRRTPPGGWPR